MVAIEISKTANGGIRLQRGSTLRFELSDDIEFTIQNGKPLTPIEAYDQISSKNKFVDKSIWINRKGVL